MKLAALLAASVLTISGAALAFDGTTQLGHIAAHETKSFPVAVPSGNNVIEVWDDNNQTISCVFLHQNDSPVSIGKTQRCVFHANGLVFPVEAHVRVTNENDKEIMYHLWVHNAS